MQMIKHTERKRLRLKQPLLVYIDGTKLKYNFSQIEDAVSGTRKRNEFLF